MRTHRPLSLVIRPLALTFTEKFNAEVARALVDFEAITATPQKDGALLAALWEPDLERAIDHLQRVAGIAVRASELRINYVLGEPALEPVLEVKVTCPETFVGDVMTDLTRRRGVITGMDGADGGKQVDAYVPLAELIGYVAHLRAITQGTGAASATFFDYQPVPPAPDGPGGPIANVMRV